MPDWGHLPGVGNALIIGVDFEGIGQVRLMTDMLEVRHPGTTRTLCAPYVAAYVPGSAAYEVVSGFVRTEVLMAKDGANYSELNTELFARRAQLQVALQEVEESTGRQVRSKKRILQSHLDQVTYEIVELNRGLVGDYVKSFTAHSPQLNDDLMSAGTAGLLAAINSYSLDKGASFGYWAFRMIKREVLTEVRRHDYPTLGQSDFENRPDILAAQEELEIANPHRRASEEEVADIAGVSVAQARRVIAPTRLLSLDRKADSDDGSGAAELVGSVASSGPSVEAAVLDQLDASALARIAQGVLNARERFVVARRFGLDGEPSQTLASVGAALGLSRESVRNVQATALRKLSEQQVRDQLVSEVGFAHDLANAS